MEKQFIPYTKALELQESGFDEECFGFYHICNTKELKDTYEKEYFFHEKSNNWNSGCPQIPTPLYQQAFEWFRIKYQIDSWIYPNFNGLYSISIVRRGVGLGKLSEYQIYEEAQLACLKKLIKITNGIT